MATATPYHGRQVAFLTRHGKQDLVRAPLEAALGCHVVHTDGYDTDQLGTFTREVARPGSQLEAARRKAQIGMELTGARLGMASEGTFGPDPFGGFMPWNTELLLWVDQDQGIEVAGVAHGPAQSRLGTVKTLEELEAFAAAAKFPEHHLALRPQHEDHPEICKGLRDRHSLAEAFRAAKAKSANGVVVVENDLRAFCNPSRQVIIRQAAEDLVRKLLSACPQCARPGFGLTRHVSGLPCGACGRKTRLPVAEVWRCQGCGHEDQRTINSAQLADPGRCDFCNP
jgi:hypothetical protein